MSELGDQLRQMTCEVIASMLKAAKDADRGQVGWAMDVLDEVEVMLGKMQEIVKDAYHE
jgi:hypothetical protein